MDLLSSLEESVRGDWNGDVDLNDGKLQLLRSEFVARIEAIPKMNQLLTTRGVEDLICAVESDLELVSQCKFRFHIYNYNIYTIARCMFFCSYQSVLESVTQEYESKLKSDCGNNKVLYSLGWKVEELSSLNKDGRHIVTELNVLLDSLVENPSTNTKHMVYTIGKSLTLFTKGLFTLLYV